MNELITPWMRWLIQTSSVGTLIIFDWKLGGRLPKNYLESSIVNSFKGAATIHIIYQIADIFVNIYDILIYRDTKKPPTAIGGSFAKWLPCQIT